MSHSVTQKTQNSVLRIFICAMGNSKRPKPVRSPAKAGVYCYNSQTNGFLPTQEDSNSLYCHSVPDTESCG